MNTAAAERAEEYSAVYPEFSPSSEPSLDQRSCSSVDPHNPSFTTLASLYGQQPFVEINVLDCQGDDFAST